MTKMIEEILYKTLAKIYPLQEGVRGYIICVKDSFTEKDVQKLRIYLLRDFPGIKFFIIRGVTEIVEV